ncbi:MAG: hypothetical protein M3Q99_08545 [Acidobacteriota bacterium]|nr:hypothetical protein [Acidobacteriota bacterium]
MAVFNIYLIDLDVRGNNLNLQQKTQISVALQSHFNRVIHGVNRNRQVLTGSSASGNFDQAQAIWRTNCLSINLWEVIIYVVPTPSQSVVSALGVTPSTSAHAGGLTSFDNIVTASEIYSQINRNHDPRVMGTRLPSPAFLAKMAFHESMHYKLNMDNPTLHNQPGNGLSSENIDDGTVLSNNDIILMERVLSTPRTPWLNGCTIYQRNAARDSSLGRDLNF